MQRRTVRRFNRGVRPSRFWADISAGWVLNESTDAAAKLIELQMPASLTSLTADPPEDLTILRLAGQFNLSLSGASSTWVLALLVQDTNWTLGTTFLVDSDKRMLWHRAFTSTAVAGSHVWTPPGILTVNAATLVNQLGVCDIDIAPKVKLEAGKALYLAAYEEAGSTTLTSSAVNMRVLCQRTMRSR